MHSRENTTSQEHLKTGRPKVHFNRIVTMRRKSVIHHFNQLCINSAGRPKEFWNTLRPLMHSKRGPPNGYITFKENNTIIKDQNLVAETLNSYFTK